MQKRLPTEAFRHEKTILTASNQPRLDIRNVSKSFGGIRALRDVSFAVKPGEVHALIGENGAGKSTLAKIVTGLEQPDTGEILLNGAPCHFRSPMEARRSGVVAVYQEPKVFLIPQEPDGIVTAALDINAPVPALKQARSRGAVVVTFDADVAEPGRNLFVKMAPFEIQAKAMLDSALANASDGGKAIWVAPTPTVANFISQKKALDDQIASNPKYKSIQFVDTLYANDDPDKSYSVASSAMQAYPELKLFLSGSGISTPAINKAIMDTKRSGQVFSTGFALPSTMKTYLDNGTCKQFALYFDTAPLYGQGQSEHRFGRILRRLPEQDFVLSTKVGRCLVPEVAEKVDHRWFKGGLNFRPIDERKGIGILIAGPYNSGILATGAVPGAKYNYREAPPEIMKKVALIEAVCRRHNVPLAACALQFPLGHPSMKTVVPGAVTPEEIDRNVALMSTNIPADLWSELKHEGLLRSDAPVPD